MNEEAIKILEEERMSLRRLVIDSNIPQLKPKYEAIIMAIEALKAQENMIPLDGEDIMFVTTEEYEALKAKEWIPCSERLPKEEKKTYWVCTDTECQCECRWTNNRFGIGDGEWGWSIFDTPQYTKPVAWMPLPEPYKEGE